MYIGFVVLLTVYYIDEAVSHCMVEGCILLLLGTFYLEKKAMDSEVPAAQALIRPEILL